MFGAPVWSDRVEGHGVNLRTAGTERAGVERAGAGRAGAGRAGAGRAGAGRASAGRTGFGGADGRHLSLVQLPMGSVLRPLIVASMLMIALLPSVAGADPAGPTNFKSTVVSIEPPVQGLKVEILGGDAFVQLTAPPGVDVMVMGYEGEPYLDFTSSGTVRENQLSPAKFLNEDRYGQTVAPPQATADAEPAWRQVSDTNAWAWHDHRTHLMTGAPLGTSPGDTVAEGGIPLVVDGQSVLVTVETTWMPAPNPVPWIAAGIAACIGVGYLCWKGRSKSTYVGFALAVLAAAAGLSDYLSMPAEARSSAAAWVLPLVSIGILAYGRMRGGGTGLAADILAGIQLTSWGYGRLNQLNKAILPGDLPYWLERVVTIVVLIGGAGLVVAAVLGIVSMRQSTARPAGAESNGGQHDDGTAAPA